MLPQDATRDDPDVTPGYNKEHALMLPQGATRDDLAVTPGYKEGQGQYPEVTPGSDARRKYTQDKCVFKSSRGR